MSPAAIAIIPLVLAVAGGWAAWFNVFEDEDTGSRVFGATIVTACCVLFFTFAAYLAFVVVTDDWSVSA